VTDGACYCSYGELKGGDDDESKRVKECSRLADFIETTDARPGGRGTEGGGGRGTMRTAAEKTLPAVHEIKAVQSVV
jgi:hypothetical protein